MRILIVSDIHSNLIALEAVLQDAGPFDQLWCLGDTVGYGPQPNECIAAVRGFDHVVIPGNHDHGVLGKISLDDFNPVARMANLWNRERLDWESRAWLEELPKIAVAEGVTLAHGSPRSPIWEYLISPAAAQENFSHFDTQLCLVGHSHVPSIFVDSPGTRASRSLAPMPHEPIMLDDHRYIINPGSVGQPRDGVPLAAYMLYETESRIFEHRRVAYDIEATQYLMRQASLPQPLIGRLEMGW